MNKTLKTIVWITAGVAVVSLGIAAVLFFATDMTGSLKPGNGITVDERKSFAIGGIDHINMRTSSTDVYVAAGDGDTIDIRLHGTVYTDQPDAVPALAAEKSGELLEISLERKDGRKWVLGFFSSDLVLEIRIPQNYRGALVVNTSSGDMRLNAVQASTIVMESSSGDHTAEGLNAGQATITSSSGEIRVRDLPVSYTHLTLPTN